MNHGMTSAGIARGLMLLDTLWGVLAVLPFDWYRGAEAAVGISFVLGFPCYLLDARSRRRIILFLPALLLYRWLALAFLVAPPSMLGPWRVCVLLIVASILLQWSRLREPAAAVVHSSRPSA